MTFKQEKCCVLTITDKINISRFSYTINNVPLATKNSWKYLRVIINSKLNWNEHCCDIASKARQALWLIQKHSSKMQIHRIKVVSKTSARIRLYSLECPHKQKHPSTRTGQEQHCPLRPPEVWLEHQCDCIEDLNRPILQQHHNTSDLIM